MQRVAAIGAAAVVMAMGSCGSTRPVAGRKPPTTTTLVSISARDALAFRLVIGLVPYGAVSKKPATIGRSSLLPWPPVAGESCENGKQVTSPRQDSSTARVVLADRNKTACYLLGPILLTGQNIDTATAGADGVVPGTWFVNLHFTNDDFVKKVAHPYVGQQIAIVFRDVVESAPTINQGITGSDVTISGDFDQATAHALARALS
jgi:preprotein translocase subunit SecD